MEEGPQNDHKITRTHSAIDANLPKAGPDRIGGFQSSTI